jgi:hypothetical protein
MAGARLSFHPVQGPQSPNADLNSDVTDFADWPRLH